MRSVDKSLGTEYICGFPLPSGRRCIETVSSFHSCPVHRTRSNEQHPLPSQKCNCERPLGEIPIDPMETPRCLRCGHELPEQLADRMAGRLVSDGGGGLRRQAVTRRRRASAEERAYYRSLGRGQVKGPAPAGAQEDGQSAVQLELFA